jgi:hypothetical protein
MAPFINRLPGEVLVAIIRLVTADNWVHDYYHQLRLLSQVCRAWTSLIDQSAILWSLIYSDLAETAVDNALVKSRDCPLNIKLIHPTPARRKASNLRFWNQVLAHSSRWRTAELQFTDTEFLGDLGSASLPVLETLRMTNTLPSAQPEPSGSRPVLYGLPCLRHLAVADYAITWIPGSMSRLATLQYEFYKSESPHPTVLISLLREASGLKKLHIGLQVGPFEGSLGSTISLPALSRLSIHCGVGFGAYLMQNLIVPSCQEYIVALASDYDPERDIELIRQDDDHLVSMFKSIIASAVGADLSLNVWSHSMFVDLSGMSEGCTKNYINVFIQATPSPHL